MSKVIISLSKKRSSSGPKSPRAAFLQAMLRSLNKTDVIDAFHDGDLEAFDTAWENIGKSVRQKMMRAAKG
jgi:hypothetical protein